jgi:hypothetical protein
MLVRFVDISGIVDHLKELALKDIIGTYSVPIPRSGITVYLPTRTTSDASYNE